MIAKCLCLPNEEQEMKLSRITKYIISKQRAPDIQHKEYKVEPPSICNKTGLSIINHTMVYYTAHISHGGDQIPDKRQL